VYARLRLADLLLPDVEAAEPHLLAARRLSDNLAMPHLRYRLNERCGHLRRLQNRNEEARVLLEAAVNEIERLRGAVVQDAMRTSFLRDKTAAYEDLLLLHLAYHDEDGVRQAFTVAERAKSRALVDLLTGVAEKEPVKAADPALERRKRTLQADLNAIYGELLGGSDGNEKPVHLESLHERAVELEQEISRLRLQAVAIDSAPDLFEGLVPADEIEDLLPSDAVSIAYHVVRDEILAFVSVRGAIRVVRNLCDVNKIHKLVRKLDTQWARFRTGREFTGRHTAILQRSAQQVLRALYDALVAPLEHVLEEVAPDAEVKSSVPNVIVIPHGPLHRIPFHALFDGERYLLERFVISYVPSAKVYALCQERASRGPDRALVFGLEDQSIPAATFEAHAVAEHIPGAQARVGVEATLGALRAEAIGCDTLHLACHGLFRADNPMFSALKLHDGWLTAADAVSLDLSDALVTLSACESGRSEIIGGDEVLGLARAFLGAGAATLVVSLWLVQDETTADLMGTWYGRLRAGEGRAAALRAAQLELKERYPHPYYWAPFVLIGKR
jgi:CHAT domain-containing protein